jgi:hypothetical protein
MMERAFNYPTHPLFQIAPLLDRGFQTVRFDPYERVLIAKIRAGRYSSDLWDCNGLYLGYADRIGSPAYRQMTAFESRYELTPEQREEARKEQERVRNDPVLKAQREQAKAERDAAKAERERIRRKWAEEQEREAKAYAAAMAERKRVKEEREAEWERETAAGSASVDQRRREMQAIMKNKWQCIRCKNIAGVEPERDGYTLRCICGQKGWGNHATFVRMIAA